MKANPPQSEPAKSTDKVAAAGWSNRQQLKLGLLLLLVGVLGAFGYPQFYAYYHDLRARSALAQDECGLARAHFEKSLTVWDWSADLHYQTSRCCWREGNLDAADRHLARAALLRWPAETVAMEELLIDAQRPGSPDATALLHRLWNTLRDKGKTTDANIVLEASVLADLRASRPGQAEPAARQLVEARPDSWRSHWLLGRVISHRDPGSALAEFQKSLALKPDQADVHFWLARYFNKNSEPAKALEHFHLSKRGDADDVEANLLLARVQLLLGHHEEARAALQRVPETARQNGEWLALRGTLERETNGADAASDWLEKADRMAPYHPEVLDALTAWARQLGNQEKIQAYQQRKKKYDDDVGHFIALQKQRHELVQSGKADAAKIRALTFAMGKTLLRTGEDANALRMFDQVLRDDPDHRGTHETLAGYFERIGNQQQARQHRDWLEAHPKK